MPVHNVLLAYNKSKFPNVQLNTEQSVDLLRSQIYSLTELPPNRQKLLIKGKIIKDDTLLSELNVKDGDKLLLMALPGKDSLPEPPKNPVKFIEDMTDNELAKAHDIPSGLINLGNTCYMNATIQCLGAIPELRAGLNRTPSPNSISSTLHQLYQDMDKGHVTVIPMLFLNSLRANFPQFAENANGRYSQQDAEECWSQMLNNIRANRSGTVESQENVIDKYLAVDMMTITKNQENSDEPVDIKKETCLKLSCHTANANFLYNGIKESLNSIVHKRSATLGRDCPYSVNTKISRLPQYLTVNYVRFFWKQNVRVKAKILKKVKHTLELDLHDFCIPALQEKIKPFRERLRQIEDEQFLKKKGLETKSSSQTSIETSSAENSENPLGQEKTDFGSIKLDYDFDKAKDTSCCKTGKYDLIAVLTHIGRDADSGHYIAWVRKELSEDWYKFDDDKVSIVRNDDILKLDGGGDWHIAYLSLYKGRNVSLINTE